MPDLLTGNRGYYFAFSAFSVYTVNLQKTFNE